MNNLEIPGRLPQHYLKAIDYILEKKPDAIFGGSICLNAYGLINRKIGDIDIFLPLHCSLTDNDFIVNEKFRDDEYNIITSDTTTDVDGEEIQRTGLIIKGVKCCCFKVKQKELEYTIVNVLGRNLKIQKPIFAIKAKMVYSDKNDKHKKDLLEIKNNLELLNMPLNWVKSESYNLLK